MVTGRVIDTDRQVRVELGEARVALWHRAGDRFWWSLGAKGGRLTLETTHVQLEAAANALAPF